MPAPHILAAVGPFPQDDAVLARALELTGAPGARLTIVHVVDLPGHDRLVGQARSDARARIEAALGALGAGGRPPHILVETGATALTLIAICDDLSPDLVVMRAHGRARIADKLLGSTTERVIAAGGVPVLVIKRPVKRPYARVLLATDGSDAAADALMFIAALLPAAALHLVQAVQIAAQLEQAMLRVGTQRAALDAHLATLTGQAKAHLRALAATVAPRATTHVLRGDPAKALIRASQRPNVDLLALGAGPPGLIRRAFIGSVSRRLLREAACDVLIWQPPRAV